MKKHNEYKKNVKMLTMLVLAALLMGCGAKKSAISGVSEEPSRITAPTNNSVHALAYCSRGVDSSNTTQVNIGAYLDTFGNVEPNYAHLKVTNVPAAFKDSGDYIALWKWYAESTGFTYVNSTPLSFKLISVETGSELTSYMTTLSWGNISSLASALKVTTPSEFFQKVRFQVYLQDPQAQYDAITVGFHSSSSGTIVNRIDALIPVFAADPREYANESAGIPRTTVLKNLHPFSGVDYSLWSVTTFTNKAQELCAPLNQY